MINPICINTVKPYCIPYIFYVMVHGNEIEASKSRLDLNDIVDVMNEA